MKRQRSKTDSPDSPSSRVQLPADSSARDGSPEGSGSVELRASCEEIRDYGHLYVEGELDHLRSSRLGLHLSSCEMCRRRIDELEEERLRIMELALDGPVLPPRFAEKVTAKIRGKRRAARVRRGLRAAGALIVGAGALGAVAALLLSINLPWPTPLQDGAMDEENIAKVSVDTSPPDASGGDSSAAGSSASPSGILLASFAEADCIPDGENLQDWEDSVDPLFPSTAIVCPACAWTGDGALSRASHGHRVAGIRGRQNVRRAVRLTSWFGRDAAHRHRDIGRRSTRDVCARDTNADGKLDGSDVAYAWQHLLPDELPENLSPEGPAGDDSECEEICLDV